MPMTKKVLDQIIGKVIARRLSGHAIIKVREYQIAHIQRLVKWAMLLLRIQIQILLAVHLFSGTKLQTHMATLAMLDFHLVMERLFTLIVQ